MSTEQAQANALARNQKLALGAAIICFLIGWFHTGLGLSKYRVLGTEYGGFILATGVLLIMVLAYNKAIKGSLVGLTFYLLCALITFLCNLNSFYPNYRADSLIREELRQHRTNLGELRELIKVQFQDVKLNALAESVRSKSQQLQAQCKQRGFGPLTEQALNVIERELNRTITRLRQGSTQADWDRCADQYAKIIEGELKARLTESRYLDKLEDISHAETFYILASQKIDETLSSKSEIKQVPNYVEDLIKGYRDLCKKATLLLADERNDQGPQTNVSQETFSCDEGYSSPNIELGSFAHTFKSVWDTRDDGGTWAVTVISLFIDFFVPLALYMLVRAESNALKKDEFWTTGGKRIGPTIRN